MPSVIDTGIMDQHLLRIMTGIHSWETGHRQELQTVSGRELYFKIAGSLLDDSAGMHQSLKLISDTVTERATRIRIREFEDLGWVDVVANAHDARTRRLQATQVFVHRLNGHLHHFKEIFNRNYILLSKK